MSLIKLNDAKESQNLEIVDIILVGPKIDIFINQKMAIGAVNQISKSNIIDFFTFIFLSNINQFISIVLLNILKSDNLINET